MSWNPHKIGAKIEQQAIKILENKGFTDVAKAEACNAPYDFRAFKNGELHFIEVRSRSSNAKTEFFTFRDTKIKHLYELRKIAPVLILLIKKSGHRLLTLDELVTNRPKDVGFFKYKRREAKRPTRAWHFSPNGWRVKGPPKELIRIRCSKETRQKFRLFAVSKDMTYEEALNFLLNVEAPKEVAVEVSKPRLR